MRHIQIRIDTGNFSLGNAFRDAIAEPSFGLPLSSVFSPESFVSVRRVDCNDNLCTFGDGNRGHGRTVSTSDRIGQG